MSDSLLCDLELSTSFYCIFYYFGIICYSLCRINSIQISKFSKNACPRTVKLIGCITIIKKLEEDAEPALKRMKMESEEEGEDEEEEDEDLVNEYYFV